MRLQRNIKKILGDVEYEALMFALPIGCAGFFAEDGEFRLIINSGGITDFVTVETNGRIMYMHYDQLQVRFDAEAQVVSIGQPFDEDQDRQYNYDL